MSAKNGTAAIDPAVEDVLSNPVKEPATEATAPELEQPASVVQGPRDQYGVLPYGHLPPADLAEQALTIQLQASYIARLQAKIRELQATIEDGG